MFFKNEISGWCINEPICKNLQSLKKFEVWCYVKATEVEISGSESENKLILRKWPWEMY